jgi:DNA invertase Pin-like site-specific DNA recombinase
VSLGAQEDKIHAYAGVKDWTLTGLIQDAGPSAKSLKRPGMARLLALTGELMMNLLASVSQWERKVIGERTRDALQHLKAQGKRYCHTVYDNPEGIALMHRLRAAGSSYERIAQHLNEIGIPTAMGGQWQAMVVWEIIQRTQPKRGRKIA